MKSQRGRIFLMMLFVSQMQPMTDMAPWFMGGLSVLGLITFFLLLFLCILLAILLVGIRARLNAIIGGMNSLSHDLKKLAEQLKGSKTKEEDSEGIPPNS